MPLDLSPIPINGVRNLFGNRVLEMHGLPGEGTNSRCDEEEPGEKFRPIGRRADETPGLVAEVEQDGARIEHARFSSARSFGVDDRRNLAIWVDGAKGRLVLLALTGVHGNDFVAESRLLQEQRDFGGIRRGMEIKAD